MSTQLKIGTKRKGKKKRKRRNSMSDQQINELRESFKFFDKDGNGIVDKFELRAMLSKLGQHSGNETPCESDISEIMNQIDFNNDGAIDFEEFVALMKEKDDEDNKELLIKEAFHLFDKDGTGSLNLEQMKTVLKSLIGEELNEEEMKEMMDEMDQDGTGEVNYEEFKAMMLK